MPVANFTGDPSVWKHEVFVIEPATIKHRNTTLFYVTGGCNTNKPILAYSDDFEMKIVDLLAFESGLVTIIMYQVPNCRMVFADDPNHSHKVEDSLLAWSFKRMIEHPEHDPR